MGIQFISGFHAEGGKRFPVLTLEKVALAYTRTWFSIDLVAAIPFDRFVPTDIQDSSLAIRVPGLIKVIRLLKLRRTIRKWNGLSYGPFLKVVTILCGWLLLAHWFACGWFILGWYSCPLYAANLDANGPWITQYWPQLTPNCTSTSPPDVSLFYPLLGLDEFDVHARCLYWALATMSSMGYGNAPTAHSTADYLYSVLVQVRRLPCFGSNAHFLSCTILRDSCAARIHRWWAHALQRASSPMSRR